MASFQESQIHQQFPKYIRQLHGDERRKLLIEATYEQIAEVGFEGLRLRQVAASAGINQATIHYYFPTKEALITAVVDDVMQRIAATHVPSNNEEDRTPAQRLHDYFLRQYILMQEVPVLFRVIGEISLRASRHPELAKVLIQNDEEWQEDLARLFEEGKSKGQFIPHLDSQRAACVMISFLRGTSLQVVVDMEKTKYAIKQLEMFFILPEYLNTLLEAF